MFHSARLKLTTWYLFIIMSVSLAFSLVIYNLVGYEMARFARSQRIRIEHRLSDEILILSAPDLELILAVKRRFLLTLGVVNLTIFSMSACLSYFLAGRTLQPIQEMLEQQKRFVSDSSHELRTPLTALKTSLEVGLRDKKLKLADARLLINDSLEEVNKLHQLSDQLLKLNRHQHSLQFATIPLDEIVQESIKRITQIAKSHQITIHYRPADYNIFGDQRSLTELFIILLDNAIKYSPKSSTVSLDVHKKDRHLIVSVTDQGVGIDEASLPHIFDRFYRADCSRCKTRVDGYGLGLSIAKTIAAAHHAQISVKSVINHGSVFSVRFQI